MRATVSEADAGMKRRGQPLLASVIEAIGETPLVELSRLTRGLEGRILAKLDYLNPGFSKKDHIARQTPSSSAIRG
jgi:cysteine synthase